MADLIPAKEMTPGEAEAMVSAAFDSERRIKEAATNIRGAWWELAEELYAFHEGGYWSYLGYESLDEFLAQPDLGIKRSTFFQMTKVWRDLVVVKQLPVLKLRELEPSKVREVTPSIMRGEVKPEDAMDDVSGLSYRDIRTKYRPEERSQHGQAPDDSRPLDASTEPVRVQCTVCGSWYVPGQEDSDGGPVH
jgi:hypothetical protein